MAMSTRTNVIFLFVGIMTIVESTKKENGFRCIHKIVNSYSSFDRSVNTMQQVSDRNIEDINKILAKSPRCLITTSSQNDKILAWLSTIKRHVILLKNIACTDVPASNFQTEMYCMENGEIWEKYKVRNKTVSRLVSSRDDHNPNLAILTRETLKRRSNLLGTEFTATSLKAGYRIRDVLYGNVTEARISGIFGDFFIILSKSLNFTFSLIKPADGKWGGRSEGRALGWNGMVGDIAEGLADFGIGPFTISAGRSEVIKFSIGNVGYVKTFFFSTKTKKAFNYYLFLEPLAIDSWTAILLVIILTGLSLFLIMVLITDKQAKEFSFRKCFTFTTTAITFARRWSVTPTSIPGRIVFITVLITGVLTQVIFTTSSDASFSIICIYQGMWKASFTSALSIKKKPPLRNFNYINLESLLESGVTTGVVRSTSYEGNFRSATSGPFKDAWEVMKDDTASFVESRQEGISRMIEDDKFSFFDSLTAISATEEYQTCQVSPIPAK